MSKHLAGGALHYDLPLMGNNLGVANGVLIFVTIYRLLDVYKYEIGAVVGFDPVWLGYMLLDAPHHTARALALPNGKVVVSVELAFEGALDDASIDQALRGLKLPGNIIPDRFLKYWRLPEFAKLKGWRIVRIATHPELQDMESKNVALHRAGHRQLLLEKLGH